jgi:hypothetical protein
VGGGDERRPSTERSGQPGRHEEVRVDDVRPEPRCRTCRARARGDAAGRRATIDDGSFDVMVVRDQLALEARHEDPEIRIVGPGYIWRRRIFIRITNRDDSARS